MAASAERETMAVNGALFPAEGCKEAVRGILRALQRCAGQLQLTDGAVSFSIDWDKLRCLPDSQPAFLRSVLQQHISDVQPLLDNLQFLANGKIERNAELEATGGGHLIEGAIVPEGLADIGNVMSITSPNDSVDSGFDELAVVQIKAKKSEIDRRILAFIERKQAEINENNVREFCNVIDCNQENSCARSDAVFTPYPGFKSHIKVSRVVNTYGPQTRNEGSSSRVNPLPHDSGNQAVEERLKNMESHLRLQTGPVPKDIYQRIKKLEDKILELEGISPEYFQSAVSNFLYSLLPHFHH
ncbi:hypothetical protein FKM82_016404 [Ascaphus truei]